MAQAIIVFHLDCRPVFEMRGGGGGGGRGGWLPPPIPAQDPGICAFQGDPGWVP